MDSIQILAIENGIGVPDPEDIFLDHFTFSIRGARWKAFATWYAGQEEVVKAPGKGVPTLARVLLAEEWEAEAVDRDSFVYRHMVKLEFPFPDDFIAPEQLDAGSLSTPDSSPAMSPRSRPSTAGSSPTQFLSPGNSLITDPQESADSSVAWTQGSGMAWYTTPSPLLELYDGGISTSQGQELRVALLKKNVGAIMSARKIEITRLLFPPGPMRVSHNYSLPRVGFITPALELPEKRYKLFPSRTKEAYTLGEILKWYSEEAMSSDDALLIQAQIDGEKKRAYQEWLLHEDDRQKESRLMMLEEDRRGLQYRQYWYAVEEKIVEMKKSPREDATDFVLVPDMPGDYEYLVTEVRQYEHGSGIHNDDELAGLIEKQNEIAEQVRNAEKLFQQKLAEERLQRELEEAARIRGSVFIHHNFNMLSHLIITLCVVDLIPLCKFTLIDTIEHVHLLTARSRIGA